MAEDTEEIDMDEFLDGIGGNSAAPAMEELSVDDFLSGLSGSGDPTDLAEPNDSGVTPADRASPAEEADSLKTKIACCKPWPTRLPLPLKMRAYMNKYNTWRSWMA